MIGYLARIDNSGKSISTFKSIGIPIIRANIETKPRAVPKTSPLSFSGKNRRIEKSNPNLEARTTNPANDMTDVAIPTAAGGYHFAASIQKINPVPALTTVERKMKKEFFRCES
jgi:hypothetical protein